VLPKCSVVVIEAGIKNWIDRAVAVRDAGFQPFDIVDLCYYNDRLVVTDMIFLNERIIESHGLEVYKDGFDYSKWVNYRPDQPTG